jgi:uncharacterized protein DUF2652
MTTPTSGFLLIADITGYTAYLSASELEHAQEILTELLELLIQYTRPPLIISRLAGDAVISYTLQDQFMQGQTFVELIEDTYVAFPKAIERMALNNTCGCQACANVSALERLVETFSKTRGPLHTRLLGDLLLNGMANGKRQQLQDFKQFIEADLAQRGGLPPAAAAIPAQEIAAAAAGSLAAPG